MTHTYNIKGMTCGACVAKVKSELLKAGDVLSADIQLQSPQATITMQKHMPTPELQKLISRAGPYTITDVDTAINQVGNDAEDAEDSYYPILLIFAYLTVITLLIQLVQKNFSTMQWMSHFMAGFFLIFSFFKLMNLKGFAEGYSTYDILAKKWYAWGFIYPFIELGLGIAFLTGLNPVVTNVITLAVMAVSSIGVIKSIVNKRTIQCACLGTIFKLPLGKVTLFEDSLMVIMSGVMLWNIV